MLNPSVYEAINLIDTQVTSAIEAIRIWWLPDYFPLYLMGYALCVSFII